MFKVGLTGGIASGKTTISRLFEGLGITVLDADIVSRQLMQPGQAGYDHSVAFFGKAILDKDQKIDRALLREIIFQDPSRKQWLENMLHPLIRTRCMEQLDQVVSGPYTLMVVPLMFETGFDTLVDHVVCINCPPEIQFQRLVVRDQIEPELARTMIASQMSNRDRIQRADSVMDNSFDTNPTSEVERIHAELTALAANAT